MRKRAIVVTVVVVASVLAFALWLRPAPPAYFIDDVPETEAATPRADALRGDRPAPGKTEGPAPVHGRVPPAAHPHAQSGQRSGALPEAHTAGSLRPAQRR
jgi:hypothetical protein